MIDTGDCYLLCDECQMCPDIEARIKLGEIYGREPLIQYAWCDKTGGKFAIFGYCEDAFIAKEQRRKSGKRKTGRAYRRIQKQKKKKRREEIATSYWFNPLVGWFKHDYVDGEWVRRDYLQFPSDSNEQRFLKRQSNKRVRKYKGEIPSGCSYRKLYEYWWSLF